MRRGRTCSTRSSRLRRPPSAPSLVTLAPLQLGVRAVIAKSFARIHRRNLVAQGIVALTFADEDDHGRAAVGQSWTLPKLREELEAGAGTITARIEDTGDELH